MGAWGYLPFENDNALDTRAAVRNEIEKKLRVVVRKRPDDDDVALAYVAILVMLREPPSSERFAVEIEKKIIENFNTEVTLHRRVPRASDGRISVRIKGRRGEVWGDAKRRLDVIRKVIGQWRKLNH